jgi:ArsR family transcriptional regulator, cadmium/lead-responsive transcriptional repressor
MAMTATSGEVARVKLAPAAALFRSLGDPTRLAIVRQLAGGPARVVDLVEAVGLAQSTVSKHLACLRDCGLVASDPVGRASLFRLTQPALIDMLTSAEAVLEATGQAVALCPNYGVGSGARETIR